MRAAHVMTRGEQSKPPHFGVYARIRPSKRGGVGVFAIRQIHKGTPLFYGDDEDIVWVEKSKLKRVPPEIRKMYDDFCIIKRGSGLYGCPVNFNRLTLAWFLNTSPKPNVSCDKDFRFFAARDIEPGEELTVDYSTYSELPQDGDGFGRRSKRVSSPSRRSFRKRRG